MDQGHFSSRPLTLEETRREYNQELRRLGDACAPEDDGPLTREDRQELRRRELVELHGRPIAAESTVFDLVAFLTRQATWSAQTFGPGARVKMVLDHIRKEVVEVERDSTSLEEWIDIAMLAFDGAWRAGHTPEEISTALAGKLVKNMNREWPDWRTADPDRAIEHVRTEGLEPQRDGEVPADFLPILTEYGRSVGKTEPERPRFEAPPEPQPAPLTEETVTSVLEQLERAIEALASDEMYARLTLDMEDRLWDVTSLRDDCRFCWLADATSTDLARFILKRSRSHQ